MNGQDVPVAIAMEPAFLGKKDACKALGGISVAFLDGEVRAGRINPQVCAGRVVFTPTEIRRYATECRNWEPK